MEGGMGGGGGVAVVQLEDAVKMLVEHLVRPVLPRGAARTERSMASEKQQDVAQQIHTAVVLYNYYHRKLSPQLAFADAKRFFMCSSLAVGEDLLPYLSMVHEPDNNSGEDVEHSVTDKAAMDACEIARALDASKDSPDMTLWPISKVAVLLLNLTRKQCLIEYGANTKGVWSIIEKEFDAATGSSNQPTGHESTNQATSGALDGPLMLQQLAFSEVEHRTGLKRSNLRFLDEDLAYSLSKKGTATKLFIVGYEQTTKNNLVEIPLEELISRKWPSDSSPNEKSQRHGRCSLLEEQEANSKSKMQRQNRKVSTPKRKKQVIEAICTRNNHNCSANEHKKNSKRKSEASRTTAAVDVEGQDGESPRKENETLVVADVATSNLATKSINATGTTATSEGTIVLQAGVQMDKNIIQKQSMCGDDVFSRKAPCIDPVMENVASEGQNMEVSVKSGGITEKKNDQFHDSLKSIQKIRDDFLREQCIIEERSAQCEMDFQTMLSEGEMTPKVRSIVDKYKDTSSNMMEVANSSFSGEGGQTMSTKRKRLSEARNFLHKKCQELDEICHENNWILPRYAVIPSIGDGMFHATVRLAGPDFEMSANGDCHMTPHEAKCSAATNMIFELCKKATEETTRTEQHDT